MKTLNLFEVMFSNVSMGECLLALKDPLDKTFVVTPNLDHLITLRKDPDFREAYKKASLVLADGWPIIVASKLLGKPIKEKVSGSDLFVKLLPILNENKNTIYIVGPSQEINNAFEEKLKYEFPNIKAVGKDAPPFGFEKTDYAETMTKNISRVSADVLFLFLGSPKSEIFISKFFDSLKFKIALCLGASIKFYTGHEKRAPKWMQKSGLEWFWRMIHNPRRLFKRYFFDFVGFIPIFFKELLKKK